MKKLIIAVSVIAFACVTNAASFIWGFSSDSIEDSTGAYIDGGTAFLYLGTVTASDTGFNTGSAVLLASDGQNSDYYFGNMNTSAFSSSDALTSTDAGQAYTLILLEEAGVTTLDGYEGNYIIANGTSTQGVIPGTQSNTYYAKFEDATAYGASAWQPMAAPEPTSGLLMLLGLAGLALKRKHA